MALYKKPLYNVPSLLITLFLSLEILSFFFLNKVVFDICFIFMGIAIFVHQFRYITTYRLKLLFIFLIVAFYSFFIGFAFQHRVTTIPLRLLMHFSLLILLIRYRIEHTHIKKLLYVYIAYILFCILFKGVTLRTVLAAGSENFVGWIALSLGGYYYLLCFLNRGKIQLAVSLVVLIFAILCVGRGTIGGALILFFSVFYLQISKTKLSYKLLFGGLAIFITGMLYFSHSVGDLTSMYFRKFEEKGIGLDDRDFIIQAYWDKLNIQTFFMGITPEQYPFTIHNGNFHNSYLLAHSQFGVIGASYILFILITIIFKMKNRWFLCLLLISISLRVFTDTIAYIGYIDFLIFYHLYVIWNNQYLEQRTKLNLK